MTTAIIALLLITSAHGKSPPRYDACPWKGAPTALIVPAGLSVDGFTYRISKRKHLEALQALMAQCNASASIPALMKWRAAKAQLGAHNRKVAAYAVKAGMSTAAGKDMTAEIEVKAKVFAADLIPLTSAVQERKADFGTALYSTASR